MDISFVILLMVVMAILDMIGRMLRKRAAVAPDEKAGPVDSTDVLKYLTGEDPGAEPGAPRTSVPARAGRDQPALVALQRGEAAAPPPARGLSAAPGLPVAERHPASAPPVPVREARVLELRDRSPREIQGPDRSPREIVLRDRSPREVELRDRSPRDVELRGGDPRPVEHGRSAGAAGTPELSPPPAPVRRTRSGGVGDRLGLGSASGLRRLVVAREVLGPPLALRKE